MIAPVKAVAFDYGVLGPDLSERLRQQAARIRRRIANTTAAFIEVGRDLLAVKQSLEHGQFAAWLKAECGIEERTARNYMSAAAFAEGKTEMISVLPPTTLYLLAAKSTPAEIVNEVMPTVEAGAPMPAEVIREKIAQAKFDKLSAERKAREAERQAKLSPRTRKRHKERERERQEQARKQQEQQAQERAAVRNLALETIERLGNDGARYLVDIKRTSRWWDLSKAVDELPELLANRSATPFIQPKPHRRHESTKAAVDAAVDAPVPSTESVREEGIPEFLKVENRGRSYSDAPSC
jgi:hypothetical protein